MPSISHTLPQIDSMLQQLTVVSESINVKEQFVVNNYWTIELLIHQFLKISY